MERLQSSAKRLKKSYIRCMELLFPRDELRDVIGTELRQSPKVDEHKNQKFGVVTE